MKVPGLIGKQTEFRHLCDCTFNSRPGRTDSGGILGSVPKRDMDETINSDDEFEDVMTDLLNAGLVTYEEDEAPEDGD